MTTADKDFDRELVATLRKLRSFAAKLTRNRTETDDLVQDTMVRALGSREQFVAGTNMLAWLRTIMRNHFLSEKRRSWRLSQYDADVDFRTSPARQDDAAELAETFSALMTLTPEQRRVLIQIGVGGSSYRDVAVAEGVKEGTAKSRISRARKALAAAGASGHRIAFDTAAEVFLGAVPV